MRFRVETSASSEADAHEIYGWLAMQSEQGAANWWNALVDALGTLRKSADSFGLAPDPFEQSEKIHEFTFSTRLGNAYQIVYIIRGRTVHVLRIRGTGQPMLAPDDIEIPEKE